MATPAADSNLSLGKLGRAAFGTAAYTTEISMSDCAGNTTADQDHSIGGFYISAVTPWYLLAGMLNNDELSVVQVKFPALVAIRDVNNEFALVKVIS